MTKLGAGDDIPANAVRNKKERDRYAVVTHTLQILKTKLKMSHGNQTKVLEAALVELRRLKADQTVKIQERDRLFQCLQLPIPQQSDPNNQTIPDYSKLIQQAAVQIKEEGRPIANTIPLRARFDEEVKIPVPQYPASLPTVFQRYSPAAPFFPPAMGFPTHPPDQWMQPPWMGHQFLHPNPIIQQNFTNIQNTVNRIETAPPNNHCYRAPTPPAAVEDTQILHEFLLGQFNG